MTQSKTKPFLVIGLPRSKTAWLSNYFTNYGITCYHEPSVNHRVERIEEMLGDKHGASDSGLVFSSDWVIRRVNTGKVRVLIVNRPKEDVAKSLEVAYKAEGLEIKSVEFVVELFNFNLRNIKASIFDKNPDRMDVEFDDVFDRIEEIHNFCTPEIPFDAQRFKVLKDLKVTQIISNRLNGGDEIQSEDIRNSVDTFIGGDLP